MMKIRGMSQRSRWKINLGSAGCKWHLRNGIITSGGKSLSNLVGFCINVRTLATNYRDSEGCITKKSKILQPSTWSREAPPLANTHIYPFPPIGNQTKLYLAAMLGSI
jgi:hypothetical protein